MRRISCRRRSSILPMVTCVIVTTSCVTKADAATISFSGTVLDSCVLAVSTPGVLGTSSTGTRIGSEETGGGAAVMTVVATGATPTIQFAAPSLATSPAGLAGTPTVSLRYTSLRGASQAYTSSASSYTLSGGLLDTVTANARADNSPGFAAGNYSITTVVTCQQ